ncbi:MAG TPA: hypothetical protein DEQ39_06250 [Atlantibacter hermannii]|nr:hypothetical protein [Enterobacteriaceae bacterium]HAP81282.1 hypothetical protein [Enterobacteriaceae bacterium]HCC10457.1 hypothetical protein [Atlantibacter hermannii]
MSVSPVRYSRWRFSLQLFGRGNLFGCQTTLSVEIIFGLTLALSHKEVSVHYPSRKHVAQRVYHQRIVLVVPKKWQRNAISFWLGRWVLAKARLGVS